MSDEPKTITLNLGQAGGSPKQARGSTKLKPKQDGPLSKEFLQNFDKLLKTYSVRKKFDIALAVSPRKDGVPPRAQRPRFMVSSKDNKPKLSPIQIAVRATKHAKKNDKPEHHGAAQEHWHKMAANEKDPLYRDHYKAMADHHFRRSYGKDSKIPYRIESKHRDRLPGGLADKSKPSDFCPRELERGIEVEREHTKDGGLAREIAMDHLKEDPRYYTKLKRIHKEGDSFFGDLTEEWVHLTERNRVKWKKGRKPKEMEEYGSKGSVMAVGGIGDSGHFPPTLGFPSS
jgi:hypothetical protein